MPRTVKEQIELALDLVKCLNMFTEDLDMMQRAYTNRCANLREAGMLDEPLQRIEQECLYPTIQSINRTIDAILNRDIPKVKNYIQKLIVLLGTDGGGSETSSSTNNTAQKSKSKTERFKEVTQQIKEKMEEGLDESKFPDESGFETPQNTRPHLSPEQEEAIIQSMNKQR